MEKKLRRRIKNVLLLGLTVMLSCGAAYAQNTKTVSGTVTSSDDRQPMPGVSVYLNETTAGTVTSVDGKYSITAKPGDVFSFKFLSFVTQKVMVGESDVIDVSLRPSASSLDEVVVIGYGKVDKNDLTGAVSSIKAEGIVQTQPTTIDQALQGKLPGVSVQQVSGQPGGGVSVQIRGLTGFTNNPPLYVIDGVQIPPNAQSPNGGSGSNPLSTINPSDIASIDILKDASATAIYGSQASNGVIIITTKRGKGGAPSITYDGYVGSQSLPKYYDVMNLREYATFMNEKGVIIGYDLRPQFVNPQYLGEGTDWQKVLYRTAPQQNHNLSVSGGNDNTKYYLSGTYFSQTGIALGSDFKRTTVKLNLDNKTTKWLNIGTNINFVNAAENVATSNTGVIRQALNQTPDVQARTPEGDFGGNDPNIYGAVGANPLTLATIVKDFKNRYQAIGNAYAEIRFNQDFTLRNEVAGNFDFGTEDKFDPTYINGAYTKTSNSGSFSNGQNFYSSITNYLTYAHTFSGKYAVNAVLGHEAQKLTSNNVYASRTNFASNNVQAISSGDPTTALNSGNKGQGALEAYFTRLNFTYDNKYLLTGTVRRDGSSKFSEANRTNYTYSGAFAWKVNQENFLKGIKQISDLKLRLGYGLVNNQNIAEYAYGSTLATVATGLSGNAQLTSTLGNPNVKWEHTKSYNVGLDIGLFNNRIQLTIDAYDKKTSDLLMGQHLPYYSGTYPAGGYSPGAILSPYVNIGSVSNKGIEVSLNTTNIQTSNFNWKTGIVFSRNVNKVLALAEGTDAIFGNNTKTVVGRSIGEFYGYQTLGLYKNAADFDKYPAVRQNASGDIPITPGSGGVWVGDVIFKDKNKNTIIDVNDQTYLGSPLPKFQFGINNNFTYKSFDLSVFLSGSYGNKIFNQISVSGNDPNQNFGYFPSVINYARIGLIDANGATDDIDNVYITNPSTNITRISQATGNQNTSFSDRYVEDGSYLKCKSIALGYNFPTKLLSKVHLKSFRVYGNVTNVFTITNYSGYDPEIGSYDPLAVGIDNGYYAQSRVFTLGAIISLNN